MDLEFFDCGGRDVVDFFRFCDCSAENTALIDCESGDDAALVGDCFQAGEFAGAE